MPSTNAPTHVFLVHGVGLPSEDLFGRQLTQKLVEIGVPEPGIHRIDWHQSVELPYLDLETTDKPFRVINFRQIAGLIRGLVGAAALPGPRNFRLSRCIYFLLHCTMVLAPFITVWSIVLIAKSRSAFSSNGLSHSLREPIINIGTLFFGPALDRFQWLPRAYCNVVAILVLAVILVHLAEKGGQGVLAGIRKCVACLAWPIVYVVALCSSWLGAISAALYVAIFTTGLLLQLLDHVTITPNGEIVAGVSMSTMVLNSLPATFLILAIVMAILIGARLLMWLFKVFADVMCFSGDPAYAKPLMDHVNAQFRNAALKADDRVVIVGHSLGSAICLNCLLDRPAPLTSTTQIVLVTIGSPITRLLARFFPGIMPPADSAAEQLRARYREFRWINVHRPFDPIGGALFSHAKPPLTCDISTRQYAKVLLAAHTGYWDDDVVINAVYSAIVDSRATEPASSPPTDREDLPNIAATTSLLPLRVNRFLANSMWFRAAVALSFVALATVNTAFLIHGQIGVANTPRLQTAGIATDDAWLYRYYETNPNAGRPEGGVAAQIPVDFYVVAFRPVGAVNVIASRVDPLAVRGRLDKEFTNEGQAATIKQRGGLFDVPATRVHIRIRYLQNDPFVFDFPTLRPKSWSDSAFYEIGMVWAALLMSVAVLGPLLLWLVPLYFGAHTVT